jgi:ComF family protein
LRRKGAAAGDEYRAMLPARGCSRTAVVAVNQGGAFVSTIAKARMGRLPRWMVRAGAGLGQAVAGVLLPATCCVCGARAPDADLDLCAVCATQLPVNHESTVVLNAGPSTPVRIVVPLLYAYPVDHWVRALKFGGERVYARVLGVLLARAVTALPDLLVPVPLHSSRYRSRGFNQAAAIARVAGKALRVRVDERLLVRRVPTREQSGLSVRARRRNVRGAFEATRRIEAQRVAIVDDVLTTGSTALAAARVLVAAGAREIEIWSAARAVRMDTVPNQPSRATASDP